MCKADDNKPLKHLSADHYNLYATTSLNAYFVLPCTHFAICDIS